MGTDKTFSNNLQHTFKGSQQPLSSNDSHGIVSLPKRDQDFNMNFTGLVKNTREEGLGQSRNR